MIKVKKLLLDSLLATLIGGLVLGIGGRVLMRLVAVFAGGETGFDWGGSFEVVAFGALVGLVSGIFYHLLLKGRFKSRMLESVILGLGTFVILSYLPIEGKYAIEAYKTDIWFPIVAGFALLFFLFGMAVVGFSDKDPK